MSDSYWTNMHPADSRERRRKDAPPEPMAPKPINVVMPCWTGDQHQALWVLEWIAEMGMTQAPFYLLCSNECEVQKLLAAARKAFSMVEWLEDRERLKSNWHEKGDHPKSAAGPNSLYRAAAWFFHLPQPKGPWLFLEPDAIPCVPDWYQKLTTEYTIGRKPFMGHKVTPVNHPGVPEHMSGVAVYSANTPMIAPKAVEPSETAFDIAGCEQFLPRAHFTPLIYHKYRPAGFTTQEDFEERVPRHIAIWHSCKDGSLIPFLRERLGFAPRVASPARVVQLEEQRPSKTQVEGSSPSPCGRLISDDEFLMAGLGRPAVDIFIKTREHDYPWLEWCLKSIGRFADGFRRTIAKSPAPIPSFSYIEDYKETTIEQHEKDKEPGYLWQQACKLNADKHTDADWILFMDSDCVFTRPVTPDDFIKDGKPIWLYTPLDQARPDQHVWAPVMEKFLGKKPSHEFMRRHPFIVPKWALQELRTFCQYRHGKTIEEYIMGEVDPDNGLALRFSEWNCLGFFLWEFHRDKVHWVLDSEAPPASVFQGFTHGGEQRKLEDIAKFKEILVVAGCVTQANPAEPVGVSGHVSPVLTEQAAIEFLASQVRDNFHKARIVKQLQAAWKGKGTPPRKKKEEQAVDGSRAITNIRAVPNTAGTLLCIHSYPGANETVERHWPHYLKAGADRIVGVGTDDGKCEFPCESILLGKNAYMSTDKEDDHLCRRLLDTVKYCLTQPEDRFIIAEYDVLFLRKFPSFKGVCAFKTGDRINGSHAPAFYHGPWCFDRESGPKLIDALEKALPLSNRYPNNSPDIFFGLAVDMQGIEVSCPWKMFTRNSLDAPGDLELAVEAALDGVHVIHGVKQDFELQTIVEALNGKHLSLSHVA